jgi:hypothetical protein
MNDSVDFGKGLRFVALGLAGALLVGACDRLHLGAKSGPSAMDVCKTLEATKLFSGCTAEKPEDGRCNDRVNFKWTFKAGVVGTGTVIGCGSPDDTNGGAATIKQHNDVPPGEKPPLNWSPDRGIIIYYGPSESRLLPEQLNAIDVALGGKAFRPVHSAACEAKGSCKSLGHCSVRPGAEDNCVAGYDEDCEQAEVCKKSSLCKVGLHGTCAKTSPTPLELMQDLQLGK